jgi:hypothetical protein
MSDDIANKPALELDGFAGFEDGVEGEQEQSGERTIIGERVKFTNAEVWVDTQGNTMPAGLELVAVNVGRIVQKWSTDNRPLDRITLAPGQKFLDIGKLNKEAPQNEWREGPDGKLQGPWQAQHVLYLANMSTLDRFSFPTSTTGGHRAVTELVDKINWMRRFRGARVYPVVRLSKCFMPTRYGGRQRPHFEIAKWITFGDGGESLPATEAPKLESRQSPAESSNTTTQNAGVKEVKEPTLAEETKDGIPW